MKSWTIVLIIFCTFSLACSKKGTTYMTKGTITGPDYTKTACSGGYWIDMDTWSVSARFDSLPSGAGIDLSKATFPFHIKLNWHHQSETDPNPCNRIIIDAAAKAD